MTVKKKTIVFSSILASSALLLSACGGTPTEPPISIPNFDEANIAPGEEFVGSEQEFLDEGVLNPATVPVLPEGEADNASLLLPTTSPDIEVSTDPGANLTRYVWSTIAVFEKGEEPPTIQVNGRKITPEREVVSKTLQYKEDQGNGKKITGENDIILINYTAVSAKTGEILGSTWQNGAAATIRHNTLPEGWVQGLNGMMVGERRLLAIPAEATKDKTGSNLPVPPDKDTLVVVVDLLDVVTFTEQAPSLDSLIPPSELPPTAAPNPTEIPVVPPVNPIIPQVSPTLPTPELGTPSPNASPTQAPVAAFTPLPLSMFGLHVPWALPTNYQVAEEEYADWDGQWPNAEFGTIRLWDTRTTWALSEPQENTFSWNILDGHVAQAQIKGVEDIIMVVGGTPEWAATSPAPGSAEWIGPNSASPPRMDAWEKYVRALATRYKGKVAGYQIWNEPNSNLFWQGSPTQLAELVATAQRIIKEVDPNALVIAPGTIASEKVKPKASQRWWRALAEANFPFDVAAFHIYPSPDQGVDAFIDMMRKNQNMLKDLGWTGPAWITEASYVDREGDPIEGQKARELVARTYWAAHAGGIDRLYWYAWSPMYGSDPRTVLMLQSGSAGAAGYQDAYRAGR